MQSLTLTQQDYAAIANLAKSSYENNFQIDYEKAGCILYISINHTESYRNIVGASFMGYSEQISECVNDVYDVLAVECQDSESETINHDFKATELYKLLN